MRALLFAVAASAMASAVLAAPEVRPPARNAPLTDSERTACARLSNETVAPDGVKLFKKLNELPKGVLEHAVWRTVAGCPVREIRYQGETWYVTSNNPVLDDRPLTGGQIRRNPSVAPAPSGPGQKEQAR